MSELHRPPFEVPVVDIGSYTGLPTAGDRAATAKLVDEALRTVGFMQVVNHGIDDDVLAGLTRSIDDFFSLTKSQKLAYRTPALDNRGYSPPRSESLSLSAGVAKASAANDFFEAFNLGVSAGDLPTPNLPSRHYAENIWPTESATFTTAVSRYFAEAERVAHTLTRIFADALGLPEDFFADFTDHSIEVLRLNNYALSPRERVVDGELTGMGEHTDFGIVTVLWIDAVPGLQVLGADQRWHDVVAAPGALLINLGDLMARWTNDRWMSTLHRVRPPLVDGVIARRRSAAFFLDGNSDAVISTIASCLDESGPGYEPITVDAHITAKLGGSRGGVINAAAGREAARILAAEGAR